MAMDGPDALKPATMPTMPAAGLLRASVASNRQAVLDGSQTIADLLRLAESLAIPIPVDCASAPGRPALPPPGWDDAGRRQPAGEPPADPGVIIDRAGRRWPVAETVRRLLAILAGPRPAVAMADLQAFLAAVGDDRPATWLATTRPGDTIPTVVLAASPAIPPGATSPDAHPTLADWHAALEARAAGITVGPPAVLDVRGDDDSNGGLRTALARADAIPSWATHYRRQLVGGTGEWLPIPAAWRVARNGRSDRQRAPPG